MGERTGGFTRRGGDGRHPPVAGDAGLGEDERAGRAPAPDRLPREGGEEKNGRGQNDKRGELHQPSPASVAVHWLPWCVPP